MTGKEILAEAERFLDLLLDMEYRRGKRDAMVSLRKSACPGIEVCREKGCEGLCHGRSA